MPITFSLQQTLSSGLEFDSYYFEEWLFSSGCDAPAIMGDYADNYRRARGIDVDEEGMQVADDDGGKQEGLVAMTGDPKRAFADKVAAALNEGSAAERAAYARARAARAVRVLEVMCDA